MESGGVQGEGMESGAQGEGMECGVQGGLINFQV
jgi:hypothetical protein